MRRDCPHSDVPYTDVRKVLLQAFREADDKKKKAHPPAYSYQTTWRPYMAWEDQINAIHDPPPVQVRPPTPSFLLALMPPAPSASSSTSATDDEGTDTGGDDDELQPQRLLLQLQAVQPEPQEPLQLEPQEDDTLQPSTVNDALEQLDHEASSCRSRKRSRRDLPNGKNRTGAEIEAKLLLSTRIEVWWEGDQKWYAGEIIDWQWDWVDSKDAAIRHQVVYDIDGQREWDFLLGERKVDWRPLD